MFVPGTEESVYWMESAAYPSINPLLPIAHKSARIGKISILKLEGIIKKNSYERRDYESIDEKSLCLEKPRKKIQALKG